MPQFISDEEMSKLEDSGHAKTGFISDADMENMSNPGSKPTSIGSKAMSFATGLGQGATAGFGDEAAGLVGAAIDSILSDESKPFVQRYREARDYARNVNKKSAEANPKTSMAGNLLGGIAATGPAGEGLATMKGATLLGGVGGLGTSEADLTKGDVAGAAMDMAKGAGMGAATFGLLKGITGGYNQELENAAANRAFRAVGGNKTLATKLGPEGVTDLGRGAIDEGVISMNPFKNSTESMLERANILKTEGGQEMGRLYGKMDSAGVSSFSPSSVAAKLKEAEGGFYSSPANRDISSQFDNILETINMRGENLPFEQSQALKEEMGKLSQWKSLAPSDKALMARKAYGLVNNEIDRAASEAGPQLGEDILNQLTNAKTQYGQGATMAGTGNQVGTLESKLAGEATKGGKIGMGDVVFGGGGALLGGPIGAAKGVALKHGLDAMANPVNQTVGIEAIKNILQYVPDKLGRFAGPLQSAAQRGAEALAATNFVLTQTQPEYREIQRQLSGQENPQEQ